MSKAKPKDIQLIGNSSAVSYGVDIMQIANRSDDLTQLRFFARNSDQSAIEQFSVMTGTKNLKDMIDVICRNIDHYPTPESTKLLEIKPAKKKATKKKVAKKR